VSSIPANAGPREVIARGLFDARFTVAADAFGGPRGGTAFGQILWRPGPNGSALVGDTQGFSNIDAEPLLAAGEIWYEQRLLKERLRIKAGRVDANTEFATVPAAADFLSSSMGYSPTIPMPSYPTPAASLSIFAQPAEHVEVGAGIFDGSPGQGSAWHWGSRFAVIEAKGTWSTPAGRDGRVTAGIWRVDRHAHEEGEHAGAGTFFTATQTIAAASTRTAAAFLQVGRSDSASPIGRHIGGGITISGLAARRRDDVTGVGVTWIRMGEAFGGETERVVELFHKVMPVRSLAIMPNLQHIVQSGRGGPRPERGRLVFTLRLQLVL
jgi:porin